MTGVVWRRFTFVIGVDGVDGQEFAPTSGSCFE